MKRKRVGVVLIVLGLLGAALCVVLAEIDQRQLLDSFGRANVGCNTTFQFEQTGTYYIYVETGQSRQIDSECPVSTSGDRLEVQLAHEGATIPMVEDAHIEYEYRGATARSIRQFIVDANGLYELTATGPTASEIVAIGTDPTAARRPWMLAAGMSAAVGVFGGLAVLLWGRRRSSGDKNAEPNPAAGSPSAAGAAGQGSRDTPYLPASAVEEVRRRQQAGEQPSDTNAGKQRRSSLRVGKQSAGESAASAADHPSDTERIATTNQGPTASTRKGSAPSSPVGQRETRQRGPDAGPARAGQQRSGARRPDRSVESATIGDVLDTEPDSTAGSGARRRPSRSAPETIGDAIDLDEVMPASSRRRRRDPAGRRPGEPESRRPRSRDTAPSEEREGAGQRGPAQPAGTGGPGSGLPTNQRPGPDPAGRRRGNGSRQRGVADREYSDRDYLDDDYLEDDFVDEFVDDEYFDEADGSDDYSDGYQRSRRSGTRRDDRYGYDDRSDYDDRYDRRYDEGSVEDGYVDLDDDRYDSGRSRPSRSRSGLYDDRLVNGPRPRALRRNRRFETELPGVGRSQRPDLGPTDSHQRPAPDRYFDDRSVDDRLRGGSSDRPPVRYEDPEFAQDWDVPAPRTRQPRRGNAGFASDRATQWEGQPAAFPPPPPPETVAGYDLDDHGIDYSGELYPEDWDQPAGSDTPPSAMRPRPNRQYAPGDEPTAADPRVVQDEWHASGDDTGAYRWWSPPDGNGQ